jgi:hypothetical protein
MWVIDPVARNLHILLELTEYFIFAILSFFISLRLMY